MYLKMEGRTKSQVDISKYININIHAITQYTERSCFCGLVDKFLHKTVTSTAYGGTLKALVDNFLDVNFADSLDNWFLIYCLPLIIPNKAEGN